MKYAAVLVVAFACSGAFASEPGQPLDCSDMFFPASGLSCAVVAPMGQVGGPFYERGVGSVFDNDGHTIVGQTLDDGTVELLRSANGGQSFEVLARIALRVNQDGSQDRVRFPDNRDSQVGIFILPNHLMFDPVHGRLLVPLISYCAGTCPCGSYCSGEGYGGRWIAAIEGFTTLYEIRESFTPQASIGFRVPVLPEGMPGADHFDTYWGNLSHPLDFTQAHALQCNYPAAAPHVGDYLTVADPLPNPEPGTGRYYVTAATYQGATRYGRKTTAGHLSGRDPAVLPACGP
jgi:hypothetical protein